MQHLLFICSRNRLRSPTAEAVLADWPAVATDSAGLAPDAERRLSAEQLQWADLIFVMEKVHRSRLTRGHARHLTGKRVICLDIPDNYSYMQAELVALLQKKVEPYLSRN